MTEPNSMHSEMARYWNENGGQRWTANLDRVERMLQPLAEALLGFVAPAAGEAILDVGGGGGPTSAAFANAVGPEGRVVGLDISAVILDQARQRFGQMANLQFVQDDAGSMGFEPASFDVITSRFGVMFFPDPVGAFANMKAALKPGGRLRFICWRELKLNPWMGVPVQAAFEVLPRPAPSAPNAPGPFAFADQAHLRHVLETAGWREIAIHSHEAVLNLGSLDEAIAQMTRMGPAAVPYEEATPALQARVVEGLRTAFAPFEHDGIVQLMSTTWLVSAGA